MTDAARLERRIHELAQIGRTDDPAREIYATAVSRLGLSAEEQRARDLVTSWCAPHGASATHASEASVTTPAFRRQGSARVMLTSEVRDAPRSFPRHA